MGAFTPEQKWLDGGFACGTLRALYDSGAQTRAHYMEHGGRSAVFFSIRGLHTVRV